MVRALGLGFALICFFWLGGAALAQNAPQPWPQQVMAWSNQGEPLAHTSDTLNNAFLALAVDPVSLTFADTAWQLAIPGGSSTVVVAKRGLYNGHWSWAKPFESSDDVQLYALATDGLGGVYAAGAFKGRLKADAFNVQSAGDWDAWVAYIGANGQVNWLRRFGQAGTDALTGLAVVANGDLKLAGWYSNSLSIGVLPTLTASGGTDIWLASLNATGTWAWARSYGSPGDDRALTMAAFNDGRLLVGGDFTGTINFGSTRLRSIGATHPNLRDTLLTAASDAFVAAFTTQGLAIGAVKGGTANGTDGAVEVAALNGTEAVVAVQTAFRRLPGASSPGADSLEGFCALYDADTNRVWQGNRLEVPNRPAGLTRHATLVAGLNVGPAALNWRWAQTSMADTMPLHIRLGRRTDSTAAAAAVVPVGQALYPPLAAATTPSNRYPDTSQALYTQTQAPGQLVVWPMFGQQNGRVQWAYAGPAAATGLWVSRPAANADGQLTMGLGMPNGASFVASNHVWGYDTLGQAGTFMLRLDDRVTVGRTSLETSLGRAGQPASVCAGNSFWTLPDRTADYGAGNRLIVELSDAAGSFGQPTMVGADTLNPDSIRVVLPNQAAESAQYRLRIRSLVPPGLSAPTSLRPAEDAAPANATRINATLKASIAPAGGADPYFCQGGLLLLNASAQAPSGQLSFRWTLNDSTPLPADTTAQCSARQEGTFRVLVTRQDEYGTQCVDTSNGLLVQAVTSNSGFALQAPGLMDSTLGLCTGQSVELQAAGFFTSYRWLRNGTPLNVFSPRLTVSTTGRYTVQVTTVCQSNTIESAPVIVSLLSLPPTPDLAFSLADTFLRLDSLYGTVTWYRDGEVVNTNQVDSLRPTRNGLYQVGITDSNGCESRSGMVVVDLLTSRPSAWASSLGLTLFPNPLLAGQALDVQAARAMPALNWALHDAQGRILWRGNTSAGLTATQLALPDHLPAGRYTMVATGSMGQAAWGLLVR